MDATGFHSKEGRLEESLRAAETLIANGDNLSVGKFIGLLKGGRGSSGGHLLLEVKSNIAELLLDVTNNLTLSSGGERIATLSKDLHQVVGELTSSKVKTNDGMGEGITFIDGDTVGDTITRVHDNTSGTSRGIKRENSLDSNVHSGHVEGLEHDLGHLFTVSLGVEGSLSEKDGLFLRSNTELIVEGVVPDLLHIIPVCNDSMLNRVLEGKDTSLGLGLISNKSSLAHAGAIVNNESSNVFVTHFNSCIEPLYPWISPVAWLSMKMGKPISEGTIALYGR